MEFKNFGFNQATVAFLGTVTLVLLAIFPSIAQCRRIWRQQEEGGKAVSAPLMIWMVFLFATAGIYGWRVTNSGALIFSGIIRTPLQVSILFALIYRKGLRKWERYLLYGCGGTIGTALGTSSSVWISGVFLTASVGLTIFAFLQLMETILLGRGQMGIAFLGVNATSTVFWTWYAFVFNDPLLKWTTTPVMVITLFTVLAWYKSPRLPKDGRSK